MPVLFLALALCLSPPAVARGAELTADLIIVTTGGEFVARFDLTSVPDWCVLWNHSVTGFEVRDCFVYRGGRMIFVSHHTPDFAAGLGPLPGRGRLETDDRGGYVIRDIDEPVSGNAYRLRVGSPRVNHRIEHGGRVVSLSEAAAGKGVTVSVSERAREGAP